MISRTFLFPKISTIIIAFGKSSVVVGGPYLEEELATEEVGPLRNSSFVIKTKTNQIPKPKNNIHKIKLFVFIFFQY